MKDDQLHPDSYRDGKDIRVELQIPPSPNVDLTTPRRGLGQEDIAALLT